MLKVEFSSKFELFSHSLTLVSFESEEKEDYEVIAYF